MLQHRGAGQLQRRRGLQGAPACLHSGVERRQSPCGSVHRTELCCSAAAGSRGPQTACTQAAAVKTTASTLCTAPASCAAALLRRTAAMSPLAAGTTLLPASSQNFVQNAPSHQAFGRCWADQTQPTVQYALVSVAFPRRPKEDRVTCNVVSHAADKRSTCGVYQI